MKTIKSLLIVISVILMTSCAESHDRAADNTTNEQSNVAKQDSAPRVASDTGTALQKEKMQYDTMMNHTISRMKAMLNQMDSKSHKMKLSDINKWEVEKAQFSNRIELLQKKDDELHKAEQIDWASFKTQSDTTIFNLNHALNEKMKEMNLK